MSYHIYSGYSFPFFAVFFFFTFFTCFHGGGWLCGDFIHRILPILTDFDRFWVPTWDPQPLLKRKFP